MYARFTKGTKGLGMRGLAAALLFMGATCALAQEAVPDKVLEGLLGREFTVQSSTVNDRIPQGGKLTFVFDREEDVVRVCTRTVTTQRGAWRMDFANPCGVTMTFTRGTRYCTFEDVKTGNAEVLSSCHRLRSRDVAMRPAAVKGTVELNDMIAFIVQDTDGKLALSVLVDSPARVTDDGSATLKQ
jgi:hypothetical protein